MAIWTKENLARIGEADHLLLMTRRPDGTTRPPVPVWVVRVGNDLFIRPVRGRYSTWYRGTRDRHDGQVCVGDIVEEVLFEPADPSLGNAIDAAYEAKYANRSASHVAPILARPAREATLRLVPRDIDS